MPTVTCARHRGEAVAELLPALVDLYRVVYSEPPFGEGADEVAGFSERISDEATKPGFSLISAMDSGKLVGAAYGWTMSAGKWWTASDEDPPTEIRDADKFAIMEWMVLPTSRAKGVGSQLMRRLLSDRPEVYATLASNPQSTARRIYHEAGWRQVAGSALSWGPKMDLLVIKLPESTSPR